MRGRNPPNPFQRIRCTWKELDSRVEGNSKRMEGNLFSQHIECDFYLQECHAPRGKAAKWNTPGMFSGKIINREHIGKTSDEFITKWNTEHADDPVTVTD